MDYTLKRFEADIRIDDYIRDYVDVDSLPEHFVLVGGLLMV